MFEGSEYTAKQANQGALKQTTGAPNPKTFFGRDETVQHSHKEFDNFGIFKGFEN